jgi:glycosidase
MTRMRTTRATVTTAGSRSGIRSVSLALMLTVGGFGLAAAPAQSGTAQPPAALDWRDQVIYFALIDRFDDGEPGNNDQGAGEFDPADSRRYSGGDLIGLSRRLDYIRGLGATALWITPPVRHQWWDDAVGYGGYHGYWGQHLMEVDPHFGTLDDYRGLAHGLHALDMRLVQDIVVNHLGNYFSYPPGATSTEPGSGWRANAGAKPSQRPSQWPFDQNDARDPQQRGLDIYHWTPPIQDYSDPQQLLYGQMADLDDLNTANPLVRRALRQSYGHWIREVGVDAFRVDTAFYVPPDYFRDFLYADDPAAPGVLAVAQRADKPDFLLFGEGFAIDRAFEDVQARRIEAYARDAQGPLLPSMINFPLYGTSLDVFARARPPAELRHRIESMLAVHADPHRMPSFVDNHDVDRFLAGGSEAGLKQALLAILSLPGIPVIYYGTEQGFQRMRGSMFAAGWGSEGRDHFDPAHPLYRYLQRAIALRHAEPSLRRGHPRVLAAETAAPGIVAWVMASEHGASLVALNTADAPSLFGAVPTGLAAGSALVPAFAIEGEAPPLQLDAQGRIDLRMPARAGFVWRVEVPAQQAESAIRGAVAASPEDAKAPASEASTAPITSASAKTVSERPSFDAAPDAPVRDALKLSGSASAGARLRLVLDGETERARALSADATGRFEYTLDVRGLSDPRLQHRVQVQALDSGLSSESLGFSTRPRWTQMAEVADPVGDDHGPTGRYRYPTDPGWGERGLLDIVGARVEGSGGSLRLTVRMRGLSRDWNPANGFDRMALSLHMALPGADAGARALPLLNAEMPDGLRWQRRLRLHGWSNALYSHEGANSNDEGQPLGAASIEVDADNRTLQITLPARLLGDPASLRGAVLHVSTWDYDGGYRALTPEGGNMRFGGGDGVRDPLWMDAMLLRLE